MHFDLVVIGTGSGNTFLGPEFEDWNVGIVERDVFGGTCLNRGCIPSKMFVLAAELVTEARHSGRLGVDLAVTDRRWPDVVNRVFGRIDPIAHGGESYRAGMANTTVLKGTGRFVGPKQLDVDGQAVTADQFVLAAGARPDIVPIPGLDAVSYHTSDTIMRIPQVPKHLVIVGGGFIAVEMAHVFEAFGAKVTLINRGPKLLRAQDEEVSSRFCEAVKDRFDLVYGTNIVHATQNGPDIVLELDTGQPPIHCDALLIATGRIPNGDQLGVTETGVELDDAGYVVVDPYMRTSVEGIWALGDVCNPAQLKHTANAEARIVGHNLCHPEDLRRVDLHPIPSAVFTVPQIASVGATEQALQAEGTSYLKKVQEYRDVAYGWALEDTTSFCKVLADPESRLLLGAHIMGPQASTLIQQLIMGMKFGLTVDEMASGMLYTHPALPEVVENALLGL